jgi:hypothetical protein
MDNKYQEQVAAEIEKWLAMLGLTAYGQVA